jgi:hypothetical protein
MNDIEPYHRWRHIYTAEEDRHSPFYGRTYSEFTYSQTIYNYYIHPQWDGFGSPTLYAKLLMVDYVEGYCIIELLGEWNDVIQNDISFLKRDIADHLFTHEIYRYIIIGENVLNYHGGDDDYYAEWYEDLSEEDGWVCVLNLQEHVEEEMSQTGLQHYIRFGDTFNEINWRKLEPANLYAKISELYHRPSNRLRAY